MGPHHRPLADLRFKDLLVGFQRLARFEVTDLPTSLLEPLVEGVLRGGELSQGRTRVVALPVDDRHISLGQALEPHFLLAYAKTPTGRLILAPAGLTDLFEDGLGLLSLAGLNELREAIHRHGLFPLVLVILSDDYSNRYGGDVYPYMRHFSDKNGRSAARMHKGEAPRDEYGPEGGAYKVVVYGSVTRGQQRTADQDQGVTTEPIGGPLRCLPSRAEILPSASSNVRTQSLSITVPVITTRKVYRPSSTSKSSWAKNLCGLNVMVSTASQHDSKYPATCSSPVLEPA